MAHAGVGALLQRLAGVRGAEEMETLVRGGSGFLLVRPARGVRAGDGARRRLLATSAAHAPPTPPPPQVLASDFLLLPLRDEAGVALGTHRLPALFAASLVLTLLATPAASYLFLNRASARERGIQQLYRTLAISVAGATGGGQACCARGARLARASAGVWGHR